MSEAEGEALPPVWSSRYAAMCFIWLLVEFFVADSSVSSKHPKETNRPDCFSS